MIVKIHGTVVDDLGNIKVYNYCTNKKRAVNYSLLQVSDPSLYEKKRV